MSKERLSQAQSLLLMGRDYQKNKQAYIQRATRSYSRTFNSPQSRLARMLCEAKSRAKTKGIEFSITEEDVKWNDVCPVLGIPITYQRGKGRGGDDCSPSLDRIDNTKGYVQGNVRIISNRTNKLKNTMTRQECELILKNWDAL